MDGPAYALAFEYALKHGARVDAKARQGRTALSLSAEGSPAFAKLLLDRSTNPDLPDHEGRTGRRFTVRTSGMLRGRDRIEDRST